MIKLELGDEPEALRTERERRLPEAINAFNLHGQEHKEFKDLLDHGFQVARQALHDRQHSKCAFCENNEIQVFRPVEHFRPKKGAQDKLDGAWVTVYTHYWWLAWTWENLYFSCQRCNMINNKGSKFPIEAGASRMLPPTRPISGVAIPPAHYDTVNERRLLVDPRIDSPLDHLQWTPVDRRLPKMRWKWTLEGRDARGEMTIEVLGLDEMVDLVNEHLETMRLSWIEVEGHLQANRLIEARSCWDRLISHFIDNDRQRYRNAAWWAVDSLCPHVDRMRFGLREMATPAVRRPDSQ